MRKNAAFHWSVQACSTTEHGNEIGDNDVPNSQPFSRQRIKLPSNYYPVVVLHDSLQPNWGRHGNEMQMQNLHRS